MDLKEKLKEALRKAGLNEGLAEIVKLENETEIEGIVNTLKGQSTPPTELDFTKVIASEDFNKFFETHGFDGILKLNSKLQSAHDQKVTQGIQTRLNKFMKDKGLGGNDPDPEPGNDPNNEVLKQLKALQDKLEGIEKEKTTQTKREKALEALKASKVPEKLHQSWVNRINLESDNFEDQVKGLETEYNEIHKSFVGSQVGGGLPSGGTPTGKPSDADVESVLSKMN